MKRRLGRNCFSYAFGGSGGGATTKSFNAKQLDLGRKLAMVMSHFHEIIAVKETKASSIGVWRKP